MSKTIHVHRKANDTFEVHVELPRSADRKVAGQFLDANRLRTELLQHGCTPEQIKEGMNEIERNPQDSAQIAIEE